MQDGHKDNQKAEENCNDLETFSWKILEGYQAVKITKKKDSLNNKDAE